MKASSRCNLRLEPSPLWTEWYKIWDCSKRTLGLLWMLSFLKYEMLMIPFLHLFRLKNSHLVFRSLQVKGLLPIVNQLPLNYGWLDDCCIGAVNRFMSKYKPKGFWIFCGFSFLLCMLLGLKTEMLNLDSFQRLYILLVIEMLRSFFFLSKMVLKLTCLIFDYITVKTKWCLHKKYKN